MDKTTRIVRKMADDDAEQRQDKTIRLRKARLEKERLTRRRKLPTNQRAKHVQPRLLQSDDNA